jgi:hypothetical protein
MNQAHWKFPLSGSNPDVAIQGVQGVETSLHNAKLRRAGAVLLVPAAVNQETRSQNRLGYSSGVVPGIATGGKMPGPGLISFGKISSMEDLDSHSQENSRPV